MKIGVSSYSFAKHMRQTGCSYTDICDLAKEIGFAGIEFVDLSGDDHIAIAKGIREHCESIGLEIVAYTVGANILAEDFEKEYERLCRCVDVAEALGAPVMRHDACSKLPDIPRFTWEDAIEIMAPRIRRITEYAQSKGIKTCTENHGWLCDIGNFLCADADPLKAATIAAPYTVHAHAKDFLFKSADFDRPSGFFRTSCGNHLRGTVIGHGAVPVKACVKALKKGGYDGWLSVEFEGMEENIPALKAGFEFLSSVI